MQDGTILLVEPISGIPEQSARRARRERLVRDTLGEHLFEHFVAAKLEEWLDDMKHVSPWKVDRYLATYESVDALTTSAKNMSRAQHPPTALLVPPAAGMYAFIT
jgi:hypothetical protein